MTLPSNLLIKGVGGLRVNTWNNHESSLLFWWYCITVLSMLDFCIWKRKHGNCITFHFFVIFNFRPLRLLIIWWSSSERGSRPLVWYIIGTDSPFWIDERFSMPRWTFTWSMLIQSGEKERVQREDQKIAFVNSFISFHVNELLAYTYQQYLIFIQNFVLKKMLTLYNWRETR